LSLTAVAAAAAMALAACSSSSSSSGGSSTTKSPIVIGTSLSLTGDFSVDGQAFERGYNLWVANINKSGGLLGHKVTLKILNDNSDPATVATNYTQLINADHAAFVFGPFSTLLTASAAPVAARSHYAFIEGAGGGPLVFSLKLPNLFAVSPVVADQLIPFADWVASLPSGERPKTAYPWSMTRSRSPWCRTRRDPAEGDVKTVYSRSSGGEPRLQGGRRPDRLDEAGHGGHRLARRARCPVDHAGAMQQHFNPKILAASVARTRARRSCPQSAGPTTPPAP
jgi:branched-chain amino acid transport system substrate-binding protein